MAAPRRRLLMVGAALALAVASLHAEPGATVGPTLPAVGHGSVALVDQRSLTAGQLGAAWGLGLDAVVGVTDGLAVGVSHSGAALGQVRGDGGLCIGSAAHDCPRLYAGGFVDARWRVPGATAWTGVTRLGLAALSPWKPVVRLGAVGRGARRELWWVVAPEVAVGLANRSNDNRDALIAPAWLGVDVGPIAAWFQTGLRGPIDGFGDHVEFPFAVGLAAHHRGVRGGALVGYPRLLGPEGSTNVRAFAWWLGWSW